MGMVTGIGLATLAGDTVLDVWFPAPVVGDRLVRPDVPLVATEDPVRGVRTAVVERTLELEAAPSDVVDAYLRLHALSHRLVRPNELSVDGIFAVLPTVVWTDAGPCAVEGFEAVRARMRASGRHVTVFAVDKFPRMVDYVVPSGVRIGDADRVRLGAYLAPGTVVMHEGFVNFNAGTLGRSMVEGRISQGVVVGDGTDIGGGASIMGTLSGGGSERVSLGRNCLLGANAGLGIPLGDNCVVEAGLYLTAGTKVALLGDARGVGGGEVVAARSLAGASSLLFRRNSVTGAVEALERPGHGIELNPELHG